MSAQSGCLSRRQELREYVNRGGLRDDVASRLSMEAQDLLVDIVLRYCEPRSEPRWKRAARLLRSER